MKKFHDLANIFPLLEGDEFNYLVADIKANGLHEPIVVYDDQILDGRNRYRACIAAGVEPRFVPYQGDDPLGFVVSLNLARRHLNESQRAMVAAEISNLRKGVRQDRSIDPSTTQNQAADLLNVSVPSVKRARVVLEHGQPELIAAVKSGTVPVSAAASAARQSPEFQHRVINAAIAGHTNPTRVAREEISLENKTRRIANATTGKVELLSGDFREADIDPDSIDVIITDPPYPQEFIGLYGDLARKADEWLKPGGSVIAMARHMHLNKVMHAMESNGLTYWSTMCHLLPGPSSPIYQRRINGVGWKPLLWFVKGEYEGDWIGNDVTHSEVNDNDKRFHKWGQSESGFVNIIERYTRYGDTVLDPFMGGRTTGITALALNRNFIGIEIDPKYFNDAKDRIDTFIAGSEMKQAA